MILFSIVLSFFCVLIFYCFNKRISVFPKSRMVYSQWRYVAQGMGTIQPYEEATVVLSPPPVSTSWARRIQNDGKGQSGDIRAGETAFKQHMCRLRKAK